MCALIVNALADTFTILQAQSIEHKAICVHQIFIELLLCGSSMLGAKDILVNKVDKVPSNHEALCLQ